MDKYRDLYGRRKAVYLSRKGSFEHRFYLRNNEIAARDMVTANEAVVAGTDTMLPHLKARTTGLEAIKLSDQGCTIRQLQGPEDVRVK